MSTAHNGVMRRGTRLGLVFLVASTLIMFIVFGGARMVAWKFSDSKHDMVTTRAHGVDADVVDHIDRIDETTGSTQLGGEELDEEVGVVDSTSEEDNGPADGDASKLEEDRGEDLHAIMDGEGGTGSTDTSTEGAAGVRWAPSRAWDNPLHRLPAPGQLGQPTSPVHDMEALRAAVDSYYPGLLKVTTELSGPRHACVCCCPKSAGS